VFVLILEGILIGCLLGLVGAGGGILAIPALMTTQGWSVAQAAPVGLLAVTMSAGLGMIQGLIQRLVRYRAALWMTIWSIPSAHFAVGWSHVLPQYILHIVFAMVMLVAAVRMLKQSPTTIDDAPCQVHTDTGRFIWNGRSTLILGAIGVVAGFLTGLLGVGGGFVLVPVLSRMTNLSLHSVIATSLMVIFLVGGVSIAMQVLQGFEYPVMVTLSFVMACMLGMLIGRMLLPVLSAEKVRKLFAYTVVCVALYLGFTAFMAV